MRRSEGGGGVSPGYDPMRVQVHTYQGRIIEAWAFAAPSLRLGYAPSRRYRDLVIRGAQENGLDPGYVRHLQRLPCVQMNPFLGGALVLGLVALCFPLNVLVLPSLLVLASPWLRRVDALFAFAHWSLFLCKKQAWIIHNLLFLEFWRREPHEYYVPAMKKDPENTT